MTSELWLVRHAESVGNLAASAAERAGREAIDLEMRDADVPLSDVGVSQAQALGRWMSGMRTPGSDGRLAWFDAAWVSPYRRARDTLAIALAHAQTPIPTRTDERLRDRELGILDLLTRRGVESRHPEEADRRRRLGKYYHRPPGGESWADVRLRLRSLLADAVVSHPAHDAVLVVAHDAVVTLLVSILLDLDEEELMPFAAAHPVLNASMTHVTRQQESGLSSGWDLRVFSDVSHLAAANVAVTVHPGTADDLPE
ncbi:histidine phosphatase family protein [uncultured Microbacterium sp.]|uniref:histidine phosphatase family protein n=1 Tax=uncultured Microbacterium sp. TaxID=191216 RepID=UPI0025DBB351|nr:histidine phosphatase family protein [uncultured Microbacterium sp.]